MDTLQLIESKRFLGREFLVWLWFETEVFETQLDATGVGSFELWLEKSLLLESTVAQKEKSKLTGAQPSAWPEAREAIRQGKMPTQARITLKRQDQEFAFVLSADKLSMSGVKIPGKLNEEGDEPFYDRMSLLEDLEAMVEGLYADFVVLRTTAAWGQLVMPAMTRWVRDGERVDADVYMKARAAALTAGRGKPASGKRSKGEAIPHRDAA